MQLTPVKTTPFSRRVRVRFVMWGIALRMKILHGDPDVWLLESRTPADGSPWALARTYGGRFAHVGGGTASHVVEAEAQLRLDVLHDYFGGLTAAMRTRRVFSLHVMCRSTIEACAFAVWVFDPGVEPAEQLLRGLQLREQSLDRRLRSLRAIEANRAGEFDPEQPADATRARSVTETHLDETRQIIQDIHSDLRSTSTPPLERPLQVPSATRRIREMLVGDIGMPQGLDAYARMSGVAHSEAMAIFETWNIDGQKPSIDYYDLLIYLHLALCSIDFSLARRAACWGEPHKSAGLHKIIKRIEHIIEGEPGVRLA